MSEKEELHQPEGGTSGRQMEFQLGGRHLTLAVVGLALFGGVLFLLGRWSERVARPSSGMRDGVEEVALAGDPASADPAAPRELTFYETLGKKGSPGLQDTSRGAPGREPPAILPDTAPPPQTAPPKTPASVKTQAARPEPPGGERFKVQVIATRDSAAARELAGRLRKKGYAAGVEASHGADGKPQYKVRVGNYADRAPAEKLAARIRSQEKMGAWIVKIQG